jgi:hypothetical protein
MRRLCKTLILLQGVVGDTLVRMQQVQEQRVHAEE